MKGQALAPMLPEGEAMPIVVVVQDMGGTMKGQALAPMISAFAVLPHSPLLRRTSRIGKPEGEGKVEDGVVKKPTKNNGLAQRTANWY